MNRALQRIVLVLVFAASSCTPPFPREVLDRVDSKVTFHEIRTAPDSFKGAWILLGGVIVSVRNGKEETQIEVLQKPTDGSGRPLDTDVTEGRFLLVTNQYLDAAVFQPGRLIGAIGEVSGHRSMAIDDIMYSYPVLNIKALHLWQAQEGPRFFFGIGIGVSGRM
ncbi:MAG TPA: Slp family lipoprotein [Nitrospirota bacterium]|nr:Slp family lipoprotein [Nitrospirota bacterium]